MIKYNKDVVLVLKKAEEEMFKSNLNEVNIIHFILATLKTKNNVRNILNKYNITYNSYKRKTNLLKNINNKKCIFYSLEFKKILDLSYDISTKYSSKSILLEHIYIALINENNNEIKALNISVEEFYKDLIKSINNNEEKLLFEIGTDLTALAKRKKLSKAVGRNKEIYKIIEILARKNKNNPILIGNAGVGKTAIVEELSNMIVKNKVPIFLKNKKIISINIASIISGTKYRGEFEEKLTKILKEAETMDNVILFIDEIHTIVGAGGAEGAIDASNILKPILARGTLKVIGATTINEYKKFITNDKALDRRFQKVYITEPTIEETYNILKKIKSEYEKFHKVKIDNKMLKSIVELSDKYIYDRNNPDKSIDILDEACALTNICKSKIVDEKLVNKINRIRIMKEKSIKDKDFKSAIKYKEEEKRIKETMNQNISDNVTLNNIIKVIESKCNSNIYDLESQKIYNCLKKNLNDIIIGQESSINKIIDKLKLLRNKKDNLPISFFLEGPKGCGKSLFVKELSKLINRNLIKLNMNEFSTELSINKILGSPQGYVGYNDNNLTFEDLRLKPNSLILIDDIEKAHQLVLEIIFKILEEGTIKDSKNELINFKNTIIFITSKTQTNNTIGYIKSKINENNLSNNITEKVNYIIKFNKLNKDHIKKIINKNLKKLNYNYNSNINLSNNEIESIINHSSYNEYGAKNINKLIRNLIEKTLISHSTL